MGIEKRNIYNRLESEKSWFLFIIIANFFPFIISPGAFLYNHYLKVGGNFCCSRMNLRT